MYNAKSLSLCYTAKHEMSSSYLNVIQDPLTNLSLSFPLFFFLKWNIMMYTYENILVAQFSY